MEQSSKEMEKGSRRDKKSFLSVLKVSGTKILCALPRNAYIHLIAVLIPARAIRTRATMRPTSCNSGLWYVIDNGLQEVGRTDPE
jgi:hypothetical protein